MVAEQCSYSREAIIYTAICNMDIEVSCRVISVCLSSDKHACRTRVPMEKLAKLNVSEDEDGGEP